MNYIITTSTDDTSNEVISWLRYFGANYQRVNTDKIDTLQSFEDITFSTEGQSSVGVVYLRKLAMPQSGLPASINSQKVWQSLMGEYYQAYLKPLICQSKFSINNYSAATQNNKYETLLAAKAFGLTIPETIITNCKETLLQFISNHKYTAIITKPANEVCTIDTDKYRYKTFTKKLNVQQVLGLPDKFFPSLFQPYINNIADIKSIYCFGRFFSAVCVQTSNKKTDFRSNYANVKTLPYKLPDEIENYLDRLLKSLDLCICTVDFILSDNGTLFFLEINPFGQFSGISSSCNYYVEKYIAEKILEYGL